MIIMEMLVIGGGVRLQPAAQAGQAGMRPAIILY